VVDNELMDSRLSREASTAGAPSLIPRLPTPSFNGDVWTMGDVGPELELGLDQAAGDVNVNDDVNDVDGKPSTLA
jgi:hypothetical protein